MELSITAVLAFFSLLTIASGTYFLAERIRIPYTVLLVAVGAFVLVPLSHLGGFSFIDELSLTPELLFYILLPILIFESAYNMNIRRVVENTAPILSLAIVSLLISTVFTGLMMTAAFPFFGLQIPLIIALLFGAIISATDPVAVLSLFKEVGAPRRLALIFEGESIFNDGTAVALFLVLLGIIESLGVAGFSLSEAFLGGFGTFLSMLIGGTLIGLVMGGVFAKAIGYTRSNEFVSITLTIVLAHLTFILTELVSQSGLHLGSVELHFSAIIATTIASLVMGNYGRSKIQPQAEEFVEKFWGQFAFLANSIVFLLVGLIFAQLTFSLTELWLPILITVLIVATGRALSIYPVVWALNKIEYKTPIPRSWQHLLAWGSLRGALAIIMVMLVPDTLSVPGWTLDYSIKEFLLAITVGCIFATLFIKATTIVWLMHKLNIGGLTAIEETQYRKARTLVHEQVLSRLNDFSQKGYIDPVTFNVLSAEHGGRQALNAGHTQHKEAPNHSEQILHLYAIGIEKHYLRELYAYGEVSEQVYKRILGKLAIQQEQIEHHIPVADPSQYRDARDVFEIIADAVRRTISSKHSTQAPVEQYMYYRAQSIIARKVRKELAEIEEAGGLQAFGAKAMHTVKEVYERYRMQSLKKMEDVAVKHPTETAEANERLARRGILKIEEATLNELKEKEMITPKTYITLHDELKEEAEHHRE